MALPQPAFDLLRSLAPCRLLSLGYPDLLISDEFDVPEVANADKQRLNHSWQGKIYETDAVFRRIGIEATYADISAHTGLEKPIDLNSKIAKAPQYDVVLDPGTLEHCFNIGQAFVNVRNMTRIGGHILHLNPLNIVNHGFYNVSPTTYYDFYELHGDQIRIGAVIDKEGGTGETYREKRMLLGFVAHNLMLIRRSDVDTGARGWPMQLKYRRKQEPLANHAVAV